jgi:drug/metabolite transporter (DMT)-like permease
MPIRPTPFDWMLVASLVAIWGSSFVLSKVALQSLDPYWIAALRLIFGAIVVGVFAIANKQFPKFEAGRFGYYSVLGFIGNAAPFVLITWGMLVVSSSVAGLLMGTIPIFTIVMSHMFLKNEKMTARKALGFAIGFAGIIVLVGVDALTDIGFSGDVLIGELAVIGGCICYSINSVIAKRFGNGGAYEQAAGVLILGAVMATVFAAAVKPLTIQNSSIESLLAVVALGALPTGLATVIWFKAISRTGPSFTAIVNYFVPVFAVVCGAVLLAEPIGLNVIAALALILLGVFVSRPKQPPSQ